MAKTFNFLVGASAYRDEFKHRSCSNCDKKATCLAIVGKNWTMKWLDLAKCGCRKYVNPKIFQKERTLKLETAANHE